MMPQRDEVDAPLALENPFWRFSLRVYARPGVAAECLRAQEALALDVNLLLFCAFLGAAHGVNLEVSHIEALKQRVAAWHGSVVRPLRATRQALKTLPEMKDAAVQSLRQSIAADELRAEQIEQALLFATLDPAAVSEPAGGSEEIVSGNVARFLALEGNSGDVSCPRLIAAALAHRDGPVLGNAGSPP